MSYTGANEQIKKLKEGVERNDPGNESRGMSEITPFPRITRQSKQRVVNNSSNLLIIIVWKCTLLNESVTPWPLLLRNNEERVLIGDTCHRDYFDY